MIPPPNAAFQVDFLQQLQRLLADGSFVATYKYALLHALADLAVLRGDDSGRELPIPTREISVRITELYWRQALPFPSARGAATLRQNSGSQAAILARIQEAQASGGTSLARYRQRAEEWEGLVEQVNRIVRVMPLWKLQTVGGERLEFLYPNVDRGGQIVLKPGVSYCLRAFHPLIVDLVRGAWLRYVRRQNPAAIGEAADLAAYLFGSERAPMGAVVPALRDLQRGECFYCGRAMPGAPEVDHFVPWGRYPADLGCNLVLAHRACNGAKSDHLAAEPHLERWLARNRVLGPALESTLLAAGFGGSTATAERIAQWAYAQAARTGGQVWTAGRTLIPLSRGWEDLFTPGRN